ncbi:hypothetical protein [Marinobacterium jannaschii]|uniref:hypothetical protein n=1 Tax=Marinobacterium jannaschii TaxID=64970 RepID=UPI0004879D84|nr:hypothetical protein [Marinobacterium jannaschii]
MATTRTDGADLVGSEYREVVADPLADALIQNPTSGMMYLMLSDTKPPRNAKGAHRLPPYQSWLRTDTANTPVLQGKIWMAADGNATAAVTE